MSSNPQTETPTKVEHTPGPWAADTESFTDAADIYDSSNHEIAQLTPFAPHRQHRGKHELDIDRGMEEICANARLIAAAPDMLAALQLDATADKLERDDPEQSQMAIASFREAAKEARKAAIAKAGGQ